MPDNSDIPAGYVKVKFAASIAEPVTVETRAVDPDGLGVNNMTLFCFNEFGLYITSSDATLSSSDSESGIYEAVIPENTFIIHFLANQSAGLYDAAEFPGQTENMIIANMEGGSGMMIYWSRFQKDTNTEKTLVEQLAELEYTVNDELHSGVKLIRNQAKVSIKEWSNSHFTVTGFRTVNIPAFGTVAPHHPTEHFDIVSDWESIEDFVTLPDNDAKMSDIVEINTKPEDYIFESENLGDDIVSVIIKGRNSGSSEELYYRVVMQDNDGNQLMIRRNHHYILNITGKLTYGSATFEEALKAPATNNVWISIDDWVNEVSDANHTLKVDKTSVVLGSEFAGTNYKIGYQVTKRSGVSGADNAPAITWIENNVAYSHFNHTYDPATGKGEVTLRLQPMYEGNEYQAGKLLIKHGKLQRTVEVIVIRTQQFTPSWIAAQVYSEKAGENVTLMFTIPETCPEALFPFSVLVSANHLDVRSESGQELPVITKDNEGYFGESYEGIDYKYEYIVTEPGKHRLFLKTILTHEDQDTEDVYLEAEFFETIKKTVVFAGYHSKTIFVDNVLTYEDRLYADDEALFYMLVPPKKASPIVIDIALKERVNKPDGTHEFVPIDHNAGGNGTAGDETDPQWIKNGNDEFLFYTKYLSFYDEYFQMHPDRYEEMQEQAWEGEITIINEETWSTNGRVMGFRTGDKNQGDGYKFGLQEDGTYSIYMLTNSAHNRDVIRIAANNHMSGYVFKKDRLGNPYPDGMLYQGNEYRSTIFDLSTYNPYRFAAQIDFKDADTGSKRLYGTTKINEVHGDSPEDTEIIDLSYVPGHTMDILLDITSFTAMDKMSVSPFGEVFGEAFEIYIDAPMLEIDYERIPPTWKSPGNGLTVDKLRKDPSKPGRFIYTVDRHREKERQFGDAGLEVVNKDMNSTKYFSDYGHVMPFAEGVKPNQSGERKRLPFIQSSIAAKGEITISTDPEVVVYQPKTFRIITKPIEGLIKYRKNGVDHDIPKDAFVAFARLMTAARIGVVTIHESGKFELNLREEYKYNWTADPIEFNYVDNDKTVYECRLDDLATLYTKVKNGETIILTEL